MASEQDLIKDAKEQFKEAADATQQSFLDMLDDLEFLNGAQWPSSLKAQRDADGRPTLTINKMPTFVDRVIGDLRQNRPGIKVKPVDGNADIKTARIINGLIKNIEIQSFAEIAYDVALESAANCGLGYFRIATEYADEMSFEQDIRIKRVKNPFTVYYDPNANEVDLTDAEYMFVTEKISREIFKKMYPKADPVEFDANRDKNAEWSDQKSVRVAEYFRKKRENRTIYLIQFADQNEPKIVTELPDEEYDYQVLRERDVEGYKIEWRRMSGREILEGPVDWQSRYYPLIPIFGKELHIEGKSIYRGVIRNSKDAQRLYNYNRSMGAEVLALAPKTPYLATPKQIGAYQTQWDSAHKRNYTYLLYDPDPMVQGPPQRQPHSIPSMAVQQEIMMSDQEMHDTTGLQLASLGKRSNEQSGVAIAQRQREGDVGQYHYADNMVRALKLAGQVLVDLIPKIYDTDRVVRIFNEDMTDELVTLNAPFKDEKGQQQLYDVTTGKYDVVVSVGPSYDTQREEGAAMMVEFAKAFPMTAPIIADLAAKNMNFPGAEEMAERLKKLLPPGIDQPTPEGTGSEGQAGQLPGGAQPPGQAQAPPPDPAAVKEGILGEMEIAEKELDLKIKEAQLKKINAEVRKAENEADQPVSQQSDQADYQGSGRSAGYGRR